jgi:hypothetical protein
VYKLSSDKLSNQFGFVGIVPGSGGITGEAKGFSWSSGFGSFSSSSNEMFSYTTGGQKDVMTNWLLRDPLR